MTCTFRDISILTHDPIYIKLGISMNVNKLEDVPQPFSEMLDAYISIYFSCHILTLLLKIADDFPPF